MGLVGEVTRIWKGTGRPVFVSDKEGHGAARTGSPRLATHDPMMLDVADRAPG